MNATRDVPDEESELFGSPQAFVERRETTDRRYSERRAGDAPVPQDRRGPSDRRHPVDRRESAVEHLRNALQMMMLLELDGVAESERDILRAASTRLWYALFELERMEEPA